MMTCMGEMYKYMSISVPPRPPPQVYPDWGPFYTQQPHPSMPSFTQPIMSMPLFTQLIPSMHTLHIRCTARYPLLGVTRTLRRTSSRSLMRIDDDSGYVIFI
ncbi:hypothetical protein Hanom_Chr09g00767911 [Helianthus anomalus]